MRSRVRLLAVALIVVLLAAGVGLLAQRFWIQREANLARRALDLLPEVGQRIKGFHRVKIQSGRKVWEVSAREARYFDEQEMAVVEEPLVSIFLADGRQVALRAREGKFFLGGRDLKRVELSGDIDLRLGEYVLRSQYARYERDRDVIIAPGHVHISGEAFEIQGEQMEVDIAAQRLRMSRDVQMTWRPRS